jgi:catabolite regulation protein CreA
MRLTLKHLALSSAVFCATCAFAANQARVDVPFSFTAKGHSYPAGMYDVGLDGSRCFVTLASRVDVAKQIRWSVGPAESAFMPAVVTFDQTGTDHELKSIQFEDKITPDLDKHPKQGISATTSIGGQ